VVARPGGERIGDQDLACGLVVVDEIERREQVERLLDPQLELGCEVAELVDVRCAGAGEGREDPAVQRSLAVAQVRQARRPEPLRRDPRARERTLHDVDVSRLRAHRTVSSGAR
jgi:hypothetical protein